MRAAPAFGLIMVISASVLAADPPIPQDVARIEKRRADRLDWNRRTLGGAYDQVGQRNPRWDRSAREAMDKAARMFSVQADPPISLEEIHKAAKAAIDAGCDDPMVAYLFARSSYGPNYPGPKDLLKRLRASARALAYSRYPAFRRATALQLAGSTALREDKPNDLTKTEARRDLDAALALLRDSVAEDQRNDSWDIAWFEILQDLIAGHRQLGLDAPAALERVEAKMAKLPEVKVLQLQSRGHFYIHHAWEARTDAVAIAVPAGGFETMEKRLGEARKAFEEAWSLRSGESRTADGMLTIEKALGGDRADMELWFDRAMKADGDDQQACWSKLDWLDPKWHGSVEEMVAFGRQCRASGNWRSKITLLVADAHHRVGQLIPPAEKARYFGSPEVWTDIKSVYDEYLKHFPNDDVERGKYAALCCLASKYPEAHAQFEALGERLVLMWDFPYLTRPSMLEQRDHAARVVGVKRRGTEPGKAQAGWVRFNARNPGGEWTVGFPARPDRKQEPGLLGIKARNVFASTAEGTTYTVRVQLIPPAKAGEEKALLDAALEATAKERDGRILDDRAVTIADHPARDYTIDSPKLRPSVLRVRSILIGDRLYELSVLASEADASGPDASRFFDSFKFQK